MSFSPYNALQGIRRDEMFHGLELATDQGYRSLSDCLGGIAMRVELINLLVTIVVEL